MKVVCLSDHITQHLNAKEEEREKKYDAAWKIYETKIRERQKKINDKRAVLSDAWRKKKIINIVINAFKWSLAVLSTKPSVPIKTSGKDEDDVIWESGLMGEQLVAEYLKTNLKGQSLLPERKEHVP